MRLAAALAWLTVLSSVAAHAQQPPPATGATAPDFSLPDQSGHARTLDSLSGPKGLVLVFFRSADW